MKSTVVRKAGLKYKWTVRGANEIPCIRDIERNGRTGLTDYVENWGREVREDYLPLSVEEVRRLVPADRYGVVCFEHFVLPFLREQVARDFGVEFPVGCT